MPKELMFSWLSSDASLSSSENVDSSPSVAKEGEMKRRLRAVLSLA